MNTRDKRTVARTVVVVKLLSVTKCTNVVEMNKRWSKIIIEIKAKTGIVVKSLVKSF